MLQSLFQSEKYCGFPATHKLIFNRIFHENSIIMDCFVDKSKNGV